MSVSLVARQEGISASQLFQRRKLEKEGALIAVSADESVAPASSWPLRVRRSPSCSTFWAKKTMENEILEDAVDFAAKKTGLPHEG